MRFATASANHLRRGVPHSRVFNCTNAVIHPNLSNDRSVRIAAIDPTKLLRAVANVRFGEAAPQRRDHLRMSALGRDFVDDFGSFPKTEL